MGDEKHSSGGTVSCIFPLFIAIIIVNVDLVSGAVAELRKRRKERIEVKKRVERRKERKEKKTWMRLGRRVIIMEGK